MLETRYAPINRYDLFERDRLCSLLVLLLGDL